jgi:hypothetical protein
VAVATLQLKLTLSGVKPHIWRRLYVPNQITLRRLHEIVQTVAGWDDVHLHEFAIADKRYGEPAPHEVVPVANEALYRLHSLPLAEGTAFTYVYDFGDHWEIEIKVESLFPGDLSGGLPLLLEGARAFPPEDSAGASEYETILDILSDPTDPEYEEYRRWIGDDFDPEEFDQKATNQQLKAL